MLFKILIVALLFESAFLTTLEYSEFCKTLAECMTEAEQYYQQYLSLLQQANNTAITTTPPTAQVDICVAELKIMQNEFNLFDTEKRQYLAKCINASADENVVNVTKITELISILHDYKNSTINQTSPTLNVTLSACVCNQTVQIGTYWTLFTKKRSQCDTLTVTCSQWSVCNERFQVEKNETAVHLLDLKEAISKKIFDCFPPLTTTETTAIIEIDI